MTKSGGGSSLREVLLRSTSSKGGDSGGIGDGTGLGKGGGHEGGPLTWRALRSWGHNADRIPPRKAMFPSRLALILGIFKVIIAMLMIGGGSLSMVVQAALASLGGGLWTGAVVGVSGFLGICAARRPYAHVYVVSFMCVSILSMAASGLLVILSATSWSREAEGSSSIYKHEVLGLSNIRGSEVSSSLAVGLMLKRPPVLVSGVLVLLGVVDCMVSLACVTISAKEACGLYSPPPRPAPGLSEGHNRKERLYNWLGQQKTIFPVGQGGRVSSVSQFVPLSSSDSASSATPKQSLRETLETHSSWSTKLKHQVHPTQHAILSPPSHSSHKKKQVSQRSANSVPDSAHHSVYSQYRQNSLHAKTASQHSVYPPHSIQSVHRSGRSQSLLVPSALHPTQRQYMDHSLPVMMPVQYPYVGGHLQQSISPTHSAHPSLYYPHFITPMMPHYPTEQDLKSKHQKRKRKKSSKKKKKDGKKKKQREKLLTDEQIERTYTGLDREIADSFIENAMEPGISINRMFHSSFEQDSF